MDIKKIILPVGAVVIIGGFLVYKQLSNNTQSQQPATSGENQTSAPSQTPNPNQNNGDGSSTPPPAQTGFKDGKYQGDVANTVYGDVQVSVTISGGKITDIQQLQMPHSPGHTTDVSNTSWPVLKSEAIAAQSAQVDVVSGATQTSEGFSQSLASALSKAA
jgi:uncharacterized protein with FMN-binding domain